MPSVQKVHDRFHAQKVVVLTISIDGRGERAVAPFMTAHGYSFLSLIDQRMEVARQFGMRLVPTTYVLDRDGRIVGAGYGPIDLEGQAFTEFVRSVLGAS
jgi:peroxiredoxin